MPIEIVQFPGLPRVPRGGGGRVIVDATVHSRPLFYRIVSDGSDATTVTPPIPFNGADRFSVFIKNNDPLNTVTFNVEYCYMPSLVDGVLDPSTSLWYEDPSLSLSIAAGAVGTVDITKLCYAFRITSTTGNLPFELTAWGRS